MSLNYIYTFLGIFSEIILFIILIIFNTFRNYFNIRETKELFEHLFVGSGVLFLGISVYLTDINHNFLFWFDNIGIKTMMSYQYLIIFIVNFALAYHLYIRHIKKEKI